MTSKAPAPPSPSASSLNNAAAALILQQQMQTSSGNFSTVAAQALLKQQEDQLRATRLMLQQRQLDGFVGSAACGSGSPPASRSNSLLARDPVAGLLGLSNASAAVASQDALSALAAVRRASVQSVNSAVSEAAAKVAAEEEADEEDDISDEEYFKAYASEKDGKEDQDAEDRANNESFPHKLYRMLFEAEKDGHDGIVSFLPSGRGFTIHKPKDFVEKLMPKYFTTRRIASFQRQLNLYGFRRISEGKEKGAYFHKDFVKGKRNRVQKIKRKSTASRPSPTSFAHRFAAGPLQFPNVHTSALGGLFATPTFNSATKELLLARYAGVAAPSPAGASASLLEMSRNGLLANTGNGSAASHQDILRNAAVSLLFKNNTPGPL